MRDKGIKINVDSDKLKADLMLEVILHQNGDGENIKACNRGSCHLNIVVNKAALRQSEVIDVEKFK